VDSQDKAAKSLIAKITVKQYCGIKIVKKIYSKNTVSINFLKNHSVLLFQLTPDKKRFDGRLHNQHRPVCM